MCALEDDEVPSKVQKRKDSGKKASSTPPTGYTVAGLAGREKQLWNAKVKLACIASRMHMCALSARSELCRYLCDMRQLKAPAGAGLRWVRCGGKSLCSVGPNMSADFCPFSLAVQDKDRAAIVKKWEEEAGSEDAPVAELVSAAKFAVALANCGGTKPFRQQASILKNYMQNSPKFGLHFSAGP